MKAVLGYENLDIGEVIEKIKPDIIALGYDQAEMERKLKITWISINLTVKVVRIGKFGENALDSSSKIKQKIIDKLAK